MPIAANIRKKKPNEISEGGGGGGVRSKFQFQFQFQFFHWSGISVPVSAKTEVWSTNAIIFPSPRSVKATTSQAPFPPSASGSNHHRFMFSYLYSLYLIVMFIGISSVPVSFSITLKNTNPSLRLTSNGLRWQPEYNSNLSTETEMLTLIWN